MPLSRAERHRREATRRDTPKVFPLDYLPRPSQPKAGLGLVVMMMMIMELMVVIMITMIVSPGIEPLGDGHCCQNSQLHFQLDYSHLNKVHMYHLWNFMYLNL